MFGTQRGLPTNLIIFSLEEKFLTVELDIKLTYVTESNMHFLHKDIHTTWLWGGQRKISSFPFLSHIK